MRNFNGSLFLCITLLSFVNLFGSEEEKAVYSCLVNKRLFEAVVAPLHTGAPVKVISDSAFQSKPYEMIVRIYAPSLEEAKKIIEQEIKDFAVQDAHERKMAHKRAAWAAKRAEVAVKSLCKD
jgi:hypothetical protein